MQTPVNQIMQENADLLEPVTGAMTRAFPKDGRYAFLAGAGISMPAPSSLPSARDMCKMLLGFCAPSRERDALLALPGLRYEQLVEEIQNQIDKELRFMEYLDVAPQPNKIHLFLAGAVLAGHPVLTTNFDALIEEGVRVLSPAGTEGSIQLLITKEDFKASKIVHGAPVHMICKLHGSVKNLVTGVDTRASLVTTMASLGKDRDRGETFTIEPYKRPAVVATITGRVLIVLGYSGRDDFDIVPLLREFSGMKAITWIDHDESAAEPRLFRVKPGMHESAQASSPHLRLLATLASRGVDVSLIRGKTIALADQVASWLGTSCMTATSNGSSPRPPFEQWAAPIFAGVTAQQQEKVACSLYHAHGKPQAALACARAGLEAAIGASNDRDQAWFLNEQGMILESTGDMDGALGCFERARAIDERLGDVGGQATRLSNIGSLLQHKGDFDGALQRFMHVLSIAEKVGEQRGKSAMLNNIATIRYQRGETDEAIRYMDEALAIDEKIGDLSKKASRLINMGFMLKDRGDFDRAMRFLEQALAINEQLDNQVDKATVLNNIGLIQEARGDLNAAMRSFEQAYQIYDELGVLSKKAVTLSNIGAILKIAGELGKAMQCYQQSLALDTQIDDRLGISGDLNHIGLVYLSAGKLDEAKQYFEKALAIAEELGDLPGKASRLSNIASILYHQGDVDSAIDAFQQVLAIDEKLNNLIGKASDLNSIGLLLKKKGDVDGAMRCYEEALAISVRTGKLDDKATTLNNLASLLQDNGDLDGALQRYEEALAIDEKRGDKEEKAIRLNNIGNLLEQQGNLQGALERYQQALEICEGAGLKRIGQSIWKNFQAVKVRIQFGL